MADDRAPRGGSSQSLSAAALLPHQDRCAYVDIPELALRGQPSVKPEEVWDSFTKDFAPIENFFCCIQLVRPNRLRLWCPTATVLEDVINTGLTLRGHPLRIKPVIDRCWLTITHLPYGLPEQAIRAFFAGFGEVKSLRFVQFRNVYTGTIKVLMVLHKSVPTRIRILGHAGLVYHPGQARTCFHCGALGHESKRCPAKKSPSPKPGEQSSGAKKKKTPKKSRDKPPTVSGPPSGQTTTSSGPPTSVSEVRPPGPASPHYEEEFPALGTSNPNPSGDKSVHSSDDPAGGADLTPSHEEEVTDPKEPYSPKGTVGPPPADDLEHSVDTEDNPVIPETGSVTLTDPLPSDDTALPNEQAPDIPLEDEPLYEEDPLPRVMLKIVRKNRKRPAPVPAGSDLACTRIPSKPAPVCGTAAKTKPNAGGDPSDPPPVASSS